MRRNIVAGNWKMNLNYPDSTRLIDEINANEIHLDAELIVAPPSIYLSSLHKKQHHFSLSAQNILFENNFICFMKQMKLFSKKLNHF